MIKQLCENEYEAIFALGKEITDNFDLKKIYDNEKIFVYLEKKEIVGFIQISYLYGTLEIINIAVKKKMRNKNIGTNLLNFIIEKYNPTQILLEVNEKNLVAIKFYEKHKFKTIRKIQNYYINANGLVMERRFK